MNYTKPNDPDHNDTKDDLTYVMLTFASALGFILEPNTGIVIEAKNDMKTLKPNSEKVVVCNKGDQVSIINWNDEEGKDGDLIKFEI